MRMIYIFVFMYTFGYIQIFVYPVGLLLKSVIVRVTRDLDFPLFVYVCTQVIAAISHYDLELSCLSTMGVVG